MRTWVLVTITTLLSAAFVVALAMPSLDGAATVLSDIGQLLAAVLAAAGCAVAARRTNGQRRVSWTWLSVGTGGWAAGQLVWSYYEIVRDMPVPFPSLADVGFLVFPVAAAIGLVTRLGAQNAQLAARGRDVLDGAIIAASLLVISWVTALGSVVKTTQSGTSMTFVLSAAYPVGDLVLATLALLALARGAVAERTTLVVLSCGLGGLAIADSAYVYLTSNASYTSGDLVSSGWVYGFLLVGASGLTVPASPARHQVLESRAGTDAAGHISRLRMVLPYIPLVVAGVVLSVHLLVAPKAPTGDVILGIVLVLLVLTRQFLAMADNWRLLSQLAVARDALQHQALHDPLTGLANRVLFADRLDHALARRDADVSVLYCDLDDFKNVNDQLGHDAGDQVLRVVASRLLACLRHGDTAARLGGDEFALLLEHGDDPAEVADRVVAAVSRPVEVQGRMMPTSMSVGVSRHRSEDPVGLAPGSRSRAEPTSRDERETTAAEMIRGADSAMYAAKGAGKGRAVVAVEHRPVRPREGQAAVRRSPAAL